MSTLGFPELDAEIPSVKKEAEKDLPVSVESF